MAAARSAKPRPIPGTIGLVFGGLWFVLGATGLPHGLQAAAEGVGFLVTAALIAVLWLWPEPAGSDRGLFRRRSYIIAVILEVVAIYAASTLLTRYELKAYVIQAVGVIVGLHFIGLWQATRLSRFLWIAGCMCAVSALAAALPDVLNGFNPPKLMTGFGNGLVLWIGAGRTLRADRSAAEAAKVEAP